nr:integrase, catalytic region, zinc finger, CCHC-type, peptidase aspartic, catalytic [Tanacetum cinerariifolium]
LQAQLGDLKGKSKDTSSVLDTLNLLSHKLENKNVELEFQVLNYARENAHLKATYKNLFDSISVSRAQTKTIIASLQNELQSNIYKNAKLRTQLFKKVSDQKNNTKNTSENTKFAKKPIVENLPKVGKTNALSKPVTSNSVSTPQEPKSVNSDLNGLSSTGVDNTKTRRPQPRSNTKNDRVPSASKSSRSQNKEAKDRLTNLYTINLHEMASALPICLMARASSTKSWLWHQWLSHLNFNTINDLARNDLVAGLLKFKYHKEYLCPSCEQGKSKRASHPPKPVPNSRQRLHLLHMDLCGPMRIASINGKRVVERHNRTLVEAARTMLIFSRALLFLWAETIATACFTQNRSIIHRRFNKTPYGLINGRKPDISFLYVFGALCYPKNDREDIGKLGAKGDIGFFIGYSADSCAYRIYNRRTKKIMETMNVSFDELSAMAFEQSSSKPELNSMTSRHI